MHSGRLQPNCLGMLELWSRAGEPDALLAVREEGRGGGRSGAPEFTRRTQGVSGSPMRRGAARGLLMEQRRPA